MRSETRPSTRKVKKGGPGVEARFAIHGTAATDRRQQLASRGIAVSLRVLIEQGLIQGGGLGV